MWGIKSKRILSKLYPGLSQSASPPRARWFRSRDPSGHHFCDVQGHDERSRTLSAAAQRPRSKPRRNRYTAVSAAVAAQPSASSSDQDFTVDLDYVPSLGPVREVLCVVVPVLMTLLVYSATGRWHSESLVAKLAGVLVAAAGMSLTRTELLEREYKARERAHEALGDGDSFFRAITISSAGSRGGGEDAARVSQQKQQQEGQRLTVHVKVKVGDVDRPTPATDGARLDGLAQPLQDAVSQLSTADAGGPSAGGAEPALCAVHCYHGFGANLGSYKRVQEQMAAVLRGVVTAHDMPGFGLTQRPLDISSYFLTFNGRLGRLVLDAELQQLGFTGSQSPSTAGDAKRGRPPVAPTPLSASTGGDITSSLEPSSVPSADGGGPRAVEAVVMSVHPATKAAADTAPGGGAAADGRGSVQLQGLGRRRERPIKRILLGHSLGGACAALEAVTDPSGLAGLVLVAPAVFAFPGAEFGSVTLVPDRPVTGASAAATVAGAAATSDAARQTSRRVTRAPPADQLGSEPPGSHVTDPPVVRRLYPSDSSAQQATTGRDGGAAGAGRSRPQARSFGGPFGRLAALGLSAVMVVGSLALHAVLKLLSPVITMLLRSLVRRRTFWIQGLQQAYYNPASVTPDIVDAYRLPQLVRGWEEGMVNFLLARLAGHSQGRFGKIFQDAFRGSTADAIRAAKHATANGQQSASTKAAGGTQGTAPDTGREYASDEHLAYRLSALVAERQLPVLIVHGLYDKLVPVSNSQRLARMLPGCELVLLDRCGHMPQEEMPELFVSLVAEFAARIPMAAPPP